MNRREFLQKVLVLGSCSVGMVSAHAESAIVLPAQSNSLGANQGGDVQVDGGQHEQQGMNNNGIKPYREVSLIYEDRAKVLFGISFGCSFCRAYDPVMNSWGATLPIEYMTYERFPVVYDKPSMMAAAAYYAHRKAVKGNTEAMNVFVQRAFSEIQDRGGNMLDANLWRKISGHHLDIESVHDETVVAARKTAQYNVQHTPSLIVGGRYIATPNDAGGRQDIFLQLANGLVSMVLIDLGYRQG